MHYWPGALGSVLTIWGKDQSVIALEKSVLGKPPNSNVQLYMFLRNISHDIYPGNMPEGGAFIPERIAFMNDDRSLGIGMKCLQHTGSTNQKCHNTIGPEVFRVYWIFVNFHTQDFLSIKIIYICGEDNSFFL